MNRLITLAEAFNEAVGDDILHDSTLTVQVFSNIIREIRCRRQRSFISQEKAINTHTQVQIQQSQLPIAAANTLISPIRRQRNRAATPPPSYSNVRTKFGNDTQTTQL
jgi:hypothetical protein